MELFETIYRRRAIRQFTDARIDRNTLLDLVDAAIQAPSALDLQPWAFVIIQDRDVLHHISQASKSHLLRTLPSFPELAKYRDHLADPSFDIFYGAPVLVLICADLDMKADRPEEDCCLAAENFMLAAHAKALGTCWVGFARPWLDTDEAKAELGIPGRWSPVAPIALGEPAHLPAAAPRRDPKILWHNAPAAHRRADH